MSRVAQVGSLRSPSIALATTMCAAATSPVVTNHFSPLIRQPPAILAAVARISDGSDPANSSVTAYEIRIRPPMLGTR